MYAEASSFVLSFVSVSVFEYEYPLGVYPLRPLAIESAFALTCVMYVVFPLILLSRS